MRYYLKIILRLEKPLPVLTFLLSHQTGQQEAVLFPFDIPFLTSLPRLSPSIG